jgi:hypothetical protein
MVASQRIGQLWVRFGRADHAAISENKSRQPMTLQRGFIAVSRGRSCPSRTPRPPALTAARSSK